MNMSSVSTKSLGTLIEIHRYRPLKNVDIFTLILPGILAVLCPLGYGAYIASYGYAHYGPVAAQFWSRPWFGLAIIALLIFLTLGIYRLIIARRFVALHQNGLLLNLSKRQRLTWDQIEAISSSTTAKKFLSITLQTRYRGILFPNIGTPIQLDPTIENLPNLLTRIKAKLYPRLLTKLKAELHKGKWLYFGKIAISNTGVRIFDSAKQDTIPWEHVRHLTIQAGYLLIEQQDSQLIKYKIADIPNLDLLLEIVQSDIDRKSGY